MRNSPLSTRTTWVGLRDSQKALLWETANKAPSQSWRPSVNAETAPTSKWLDGSSRSKTFLGCKTNAASATRAFSPPDKEPILRKAIGPEMPKAPSDCRPSISFKSGFSTLAVSKTYSNACLSIGSSCARSCENTPSFTRSPNVRVPSSKGMVPAKLFKSVDLPAPFGPRTTTRISRESLNSFPSLLLKIGDSFLYPKTAFSIINTS